MCNAKQKQNQNDMSRLDWQDTWDAFAESMSDERDDSALVARSIIDLDGKLDSFSASDNIYQCAELPN